MEFIMLELFRDAVFFFFIKRVTLKRDANIPWLQADYS